ncbi:hypothetical protein BSZ35_11030 [Salinibacter sp. 10B]|uniref:GumC family protein n=1 Tax=Salinibacter sp. 10B TaxID=1923971 RepID=UPI000CF4C6CD|nr:polysaccharide biosynthesis tyrosine autokinase [Salinibacter sp. 10B]PQJ35055.1 hypothetical protein BSZ35_11030 [Salinibacter sp. 10B]
MSSSNGSPERISEMGSLYPEASAPTGGASPQEHLHTLWRGKWLIFGLVVLLGGAAYLYYQSQPRQYRATTALLLNETDRPERMAEFLPVQPSNQVGRDLYFLRNSQVFAREVARVLRTRADSLQPNEGASLFWTAAGTPRSQAALAARLHGAVSVRRDAQDVPALRISVTSSHPKEAALVANTYAKVYRDHLRRTNSARMRSTRQFLEQQKETLHDQLQALEDSIAARVRASGQLGLLSPADSGLGIVGEANQLAQKISDLRVQKGQVRLDLKMERALLDSAEARLRRIRPNLADRAASMTSERLRQTHEQIADLESDLQAVKARNEILSAEMQAQVDNMQARLESLREKANRLAKEYVNQALSTDAINPMGGSEGGSLSSVVDLRQQITKHRIAITRLSARQEVLNERLDEHRAALQQSPDRTLARLRRRKGTTKELFVSLSKSLQRAQVAEESTPEQASIIQRAGPPSTPIAPEVWSKVLLATLLGGVGGCGLVLMYDRLDDVVEEPEDLERSPNELFGAIPEWEPDMIPDSDNDRSDWPGIASPFSPAAEAYRHVATNVRLGLPHAVTTLLVTSPGAREGKTTTTANLGVALSESGRDVLLVDADLQGPTLHKMFDIERTPGLTDRLADIDDGIRLLHAPDEAQETPGGADGEAHAFLQRTQQQQMGRLGVLPAGTEVPQPALLLQESHVEPQLQTLTEQWDVVLFDTPPALLYDDTFRLAALTDLVLLLAAAGDTHQSAFRDVRTRLETVCPHSVTALLNRHRPSPSTTYGYTSYSYPSTRAEEDRAARWRRRVSQGLRRVVKG